ncbi:MAG: signal peptidase II [Ruminococcus sp.]|nr:signal peptidase II [Ruminococcus sp.]MCR5075169.1 signal peptidase II [Ruminococcus sp.]
MAVILVVIIAVLVAADQLVKHWAVTSLEPVGSMDFIRIGDTKLVDLTYLENRGAIFGSMAGQRWFLVGFTTLVIILASVGMIMALKRSKFLSFSIMLFVAGGIGNIIDRIRYGYVVDMFEFKFVHFAIFNVADICVTFAFIFIIIYMLFIDPKKEKAKKISAAEESPNDE